MKGILDYYRRHPHQLRQALQTAHRLWRTEGAAGVWRHVQTRIAEEAHRTPPRCPYTEWTARYDRLTDADRQRVQERIAQLAYRPVFSIIMPVCDPDVRWLRAALTSVKRQLYPYWQLCIADDASTRADVRRCLTEATQADERIGVVYRPTRGGIAAASNSALELATGDFVTFLDHDDELAEQALACLAVELNAHPETDVLYTDEDQLDARGRRFAPHFKPQWSPEFLRGCHYLAHLTAYRTAKVRAVGGFRLGFDGAQDYDLCLRIIERTEPARIRHVPHVLYHWRITAGSTAGGVEAKPYAVAAAHRALVEHLDRTEPGAEVITNSFGRHRIRYPLPKPLPRVSILMGTRDHAALTQTALQGVLEGTDYANLEVVLVDNGSREAAALALFEQLRRDPRVRVIAHDAPFNFSAINNLAARHATGDVFVLLNNDVQVIHADWLTELVRQVVRPDVGVVGAKLLYPDDTIQHAGVVLGIRGVAGHVHQRAARSARSVPSNVQLVWNEVAREVSAVTGACLAIRREVFELVGGLDADNLAVAFNDVDLCLRVRERGYRVLFTPWVELYHVESASRGSDHRPERRLTFQRECEYMRARWGAALDDDPYYNPNLTLARLDASPVVPRRPYFFREPPACR
ncbi:MAG: glycosyltransferase family 2 protein [Chloracidobacterium sp.]|nr:glycosyltransferase family 2 protein [Chloracidobacterium sp.]MDW8218801.1 glycosyltransferase family 2 protein [Acidobacteriota bacterium]